nr:MAG TPA: hypothetical protein [Caudoviricetes sp.]
MLMRVENEIDKIVYNLYRLIVKKLIKSYE